jgi:hypothetical protein
MKGDGAYVLVVGASAFTPVPGSGLVSMEQAALLMMQRVLTAELGGDKRVFAFQLGPVGTRFTDGGGDPEWVSAAQVGAVAVAASAATEVPGQAVRMLTRPQADEALALFGARR